MFNKINKKSCRELVAMSYFVRHPFFGIYAILRNIYYTCKYMNRLNYLSWKFGGERYKKHEQVRIDSYVFDMPDYPSFRGQWEEIMNNQVYKFESPSTAPVILDFGANIGVSVAYFKKLFPDCTIEAYEADPDIFGYLKKNMEQNLLNNVDLHKQAVWISNGKISFDSDGADGGKISEKQNEENVVECVDVLDIVTKYTKIDMLKMDIEGAEFQVMKRLDKHLSHVKRCFIEYHGAPGDERFPEFLSLLQENDFQYRIFNVYECPQDPYLHLPAQKQFQYNIFAWRA